MFTLTFVKIFENKIIPIFKGLLAINLLVEYIRSYLSFRGFK